MAKKIVFTGISILLFTTFISIYCNDKEDYIYKKNLENGNSVFIKYRNTTEEFENKVDPVKDKELFKNLPDFDIMSFNGKYLIEEYSMYLTTKSDKTPQLIWKRKLKNILAVSKTTTSKILDVTQKGNRIYILFRSFSSVLLETIEFTPENDSWKTVNNKSIFDGGLNFGGEYVDHAKIALLEKDIYILLRTLGGKVYLAEFTGGKVELLYK